MRKLGHKKITLAKSILEMIKNAHFEKGHHLGQEQLAKQFRVSRTPIRAALDLLVEKNIVEVRSNRGYYIKKSYTDLLTITLEESISSSDKLYNDLINDYLAQKIPNTLNQNEINARYKVDRITLLNTLNRLAEDGLLKKNRGRGWTFLPSIKDAKMLGDGYTLRLMVEPNIFNLSTFTPNQSQIEHCKLRHIYLLDHPNISEVSGLILFNTDAEFHEMIAQFSGNSFILQLIQQQNRLRRLMEFAGYSNRRRVKEWCKEHIAILEAISDRQYLIAHQLMADHLTKAEHSAN